MIRGGHFILPLGEQCFGIQRWYIFVSSSKQAILQGAVGYLSTFLRVTSRSPAWLLHVESYLSFVDGFFPRPLHSKNVVDTAKQHRKQGKRKRSRVERARSSEVWSVRKTYKKLIFL